MAKATTSKARSSRKKAPAAAADTVQEVTAEEAAPESEPEAEAVATETVDEAPATSIDAETHAKYEEIKKGDIHITALQRMTVQELHDVAKKEELEDYTGLKKQDLVFKILKERINRDGLM